MKIVKVESVPNLNSSVKLLDLEKGEDLLIDPEESEWRKWEPETEKPKEIGATIISPRVAESTAACYFQPGDKKLKTTVQKQKSTGTEPVLPRSNFIAKQKLPVKSQKEIIKQRSGPSPKLSFNCGPAPKVCNPQSFKRLLENPNLEVQLVQPGKSPQIVRLTPKSSIPSEGGGKYKNGNGNGALPESTAKTSGVQLTKLNHPPQSNKLNPVQVQPPKLIAESLRQNQKLTKSLARDPPQLLRETNFPNPSIAGGGMRGRPQPAAPAPTTAAPSRGRGRAVPIPSKPSPEKLAAQLLEQNKLMLDKKQGTYKGRGRPPKTAPKIARGGGAANAGSIGRQNQDDSEGTYVAPKPPPGSNPSNGKDLPPPKGLPPMRLPTKAPAKPVSPKEKTAPPSKGQAAPPPKGQAAPPPKGQTAPPPKGQTAPPPKGQTAPPPVKATPTKSKVVPFPSKQPQPPQAKNASTTSNPPPSANAVASTMKGQGQGQQKQAPAMKVAAGKGTETKTVNNAGGGGGAGARPAPFLTRVTESSSESGEKTELGAGASYKCPDMDAKAFYYDKGVKFWVCLVCNKEEPEISTTPMICCDSCDDWYHFTCVGIDDEPSDDESWYCKRCINRKKEDKKQSGGGANSGKTKPKTAVKTKAKMPLPPPKPSKNPRKV